MADRDAEAKALDKLTQSRERIGPVNLVAADELAKIEEEHGSTAAEREELTEAVHRLRGSIGQLNREGRERLRAAFEQVDAHFQKLFARLFEGGNAHLALIDSDDPLEAGLEIYAQPPGKRLQSLTLLSGGEQALTALQEIDRRFPNSDYASDARLKIDLVRDHLAGKEMEIGRHYERAGRWIAAQIRFQNVVDNYQTTSHAPEALYRLTETSLALGIPDEAVKYAAVLGANYPGTEWYDKAYDLVQDHAAGVTPS